MERARLILPKFRPGEHVRARGNRWMEVVRRESPCPRHSCARWVVLRYGVEEVYCETALRVDT